MSAGSIAIYPSACPECRRRARLLAVLSPRIDRHRRDRDRLAALLGLPDHELIGVLGMGPRGVDRERTHGGDSLRPADDGRLPGGEQGDTGRGASQATPCRPEPSLCRHRPAWPATLADLVTPPAALHIGGSPERALAILAEPCVAIVGARLASDYGRTVARRLAADLAEAGVCVVSGMAAGVDCAAHAGALDARGPTLAVLGGGVDVVYPESALTLHRRLLERGAIVSELPAGSPVRRWTFVARNRIIAALAKVTVVVEARRRSGALITAGYGLDLGREVAAVPGPVTAATSVGTNALLREGAQVVRNAQDVLDLLLGVGTRGNT